MDTIPVHHHHLLSIISNQSTRPFEAFHIARRSSTKSILNVVVCGRSSGKLNRRCITYFPAKRNFLVYVLPKFCFKKSIYMMRALKFFFAAGLFFSFKLLSIIFRFNGPHHSLAKHVILVAWVL